MMEISDQVSDLPSSLTPKVEFSIFRSPRPDPVHGHPAVDSPAARLLSPPPRTSLCYRSFTFPPWFVTEVENVMLYE
jgi:hypothetical protein